MIPNVCNYDKKVQIQTKLLSSGSTKSLADTISKSGQVLVLLQLLSHLRPGEDQDQDHLSLSLSLSAQHSRRSYQVAAGEILKLPHVTTKTVKFSNSNYILIMKAVDGRQCFNKSSCVHS